MCGKDGLVKSAKSSLVMAVALSLCKTQDIINHNPAFCQSVKGRRKEIIGNGGGNPPPWAAPLSLGFPPSRRCRRCRRGGIHSARRRPTHGDPPGASGMPRPTGDGRNPASRVADAVVADTHGTYCWDRRRCRRGGIHSARRPRASRPPAIHPPPSSCAQSQDPRRPTHGDPPGASGMPRPTGGCGSTQGDRLWDRRRTGGILPPAVFRFQR